MKLYSCDYGPGPRRLSLYIAMKGIATIETVAMESYGKREDAFLVKSPGGKIPLLETDDGQYVYESQAIIQYLEEIFPTPPMQGTNEAERQKVDTQSCLINDFFHYSFISAMHTSPYLSKIVAQAHDADMVSRPLWGARLNQIADIMGDDPFLAGNRATVADLMLFSQFEYTWQRFGIFIPPHLKTMFAWYDRFKELPGFFDSRLPENDHEVLIPMLGTEY